MKKTHVLFLVGSIILPPSALANAPQAPSTLGAQPEYKVLGGDCQHGGAGPQIASGESIYVERLPEALELVDDVGSVVASYNVGKSTEQNLGEGDVAEIGSYSAGGNVFQFQMVAEDGNTSNVFNTIQFIFSGDRIDIVNTTAGNGFGGSAAVTRCELVAL